MGCPIHVWANIHIWGRTFVIECYTMWYKKTALAYFAHGTEMHELDDNLPDEFPLQFFNQNI